MYPVSLITKRLVDAQNSRPKVGGVSQVPVAQESIIPQTQVSFGAPVLRDDYGSQGQTGGLGLGLTGAPKQTDWRTVPDDLHGAAKFDARYRNIQQELADYKERARQYDNTYGRGRTAYERGDRDQVIGSPLPEVYQLRAKEAADQARRFEQTGQFFSKKPPSTRLLKFGVSSNPDMDLFKEYGADYAKQYTERHKLWLSDERFKNLQPSEYVTVLGFLTEPPEFASLANKNGNWETPYERGKRLGKWKTPQEYQAFLDQAEKEKEKDKYSGFSGFLKRYPWAPVAAVGALGLGTALATGAGGAGAGAGTGAGAGESATIVPTTAGTGGILGPEGAGLGLDTVNGAAAGAGVGGVGAAGTTETAVAGAAGGVGAPALAAGPAETAYAAGAGPSALSPEFSGGGAGFASNLPTPVAQEAAQAAHQSWTEVISSLPKSIAKAPDISIGDFLSGKATAKEFALSALKHLGKRGAKDILGAVLGGYKLAEQNKAAQKKAIDKASQQTIIDYYNQRRRLLRQKYGM